METVQLTRNKDGFTLVVGPSGWKNQTGFLIAATVLLFLSVTFTNALLHGFKINGRAAQPIETFYSLPLWIGGLTFLAVAFQRACSKTVFVADGQLLVIATSGPLRKTDRQFPRKSLVAARVGYSQVEVNNRQLKQLQLFFAERTAPYGMFTGRDEGDLRRIAEYLRSNLPPEPMPGSANPLMEVRESSVHQTTFYVICGIATAIGFSVFAFRSTIGDGALVIIFFGTVFAAIVLVSIILRRCRCPQCGITIKRDGVSPEGYFQYTCPHCRIIWQSWIRAARPRS